MYLYYILGIILLPGIIYASIVQNQVNSAFETYKNLHSARGITAKEACETVLSSAGIKNVQVKAIKGHLTDNYNPTNKTVNLSESVLNSTSISALGVALHEVGHAIQHAEGYKPLKIRNALITVNNFLSSMMWPLIIAGIILSALSYFSTGNIFLIVGASVYLLSFFISLITYPVEKNASKRALNLLVSNNILDANEVKGAEVVLTAASKTYLASIIVSILSFLRFFLAFFVLNRD